MVYPSGVFSWANSYFRLFRDALGQRGVAVTDDLEVSLRWLEDRAGEVDALHLNWPERSGSVTASAG